MYYVDWIKYPQLSSIQELVSLLKSINYWEELILKDSCGRFYEYSLVDGKCKISSLGRDGIKSSDDIIIEGSFEQQAEEINDKNKTSSSSEYLFRKNFAILNPGTTIAVSKSGNNILISWYQTVGEIYDVVRSTDKQFFNSVSLAIDLDAANYTYANALINERNI